MRITRDDPEDLGMVMYCLTFGAITVDEVSSWASRAIDEEDDPPVFLYTMLDLKGQFGRELKEQIGFVAGPSLDGEDELHYIRQIAVRRGLEPFSHLGVAANVKLAEDREHYINDLFMRNFLVNVEKLPPLSSFGNRSSQAVPM